MSFADRLRTARLHKGWSQAQLAEGSGVSEQLIANLERGEALATEEGPALAGALGLSVDELVLGQPPRSAGDTRSGEPAGRHWPVPGAQSVSVRRIPVLSYVQAGMPREMLDRYAEGEAEGFQTLGLTAEIAAAVGPYAFGLPVEDDSMAPEFKAGDHVVVDPDAPAEPGDLVVAKLDCENAAILRS
jgi:SOS-response transcriptional repressor LexA